MKHADPNQLYAVWDGRFQPFHKGHLSVIRAILSQLGLPLVVMIIQSSEAPDAAGYSKEVNRHHKPDRNPLTAWERFIIISMALQAEGVIESVTLLGIPRPDLYWPLARSFYPPRRLICLTGKDAYEKSKEEFWCALGEATRTISILSVPSVSATDVKVAIRSGRGWEDLLPAACIEYFEAIDGPRRFREAEL